MVTLIIISHILLSIISYSLLSNLMYERFYKGTKMSKSIIIVCLFGILSFISVIITCLTDLYTLRKVKVKWKSRLKTSTFERNGITYYRIGDVDVSQNEHRELRLLKLTDPKKFKLNRLKSIYFPGFLHKFFKTL
ncbi:MAG: hypothetical protein SLAVMIC_00465 [uncultured marine phage]|uniref:Uncharacterized protein n=1 Tax=uncultured marine phage TaxID=707152 RepID=A0A8D9FRK2_9VIRU|nr:MAG: hypothetical protein SLAVMIC_00465 [uncultured marine phage]